MSKANQPSQANPHRAAALQPAQPGATRSSPAQLRPAMTRLASQAASQHSLGLASTASPAKLAQPPQLSKPKPAYHIQTCGAELLPARRSTPAQTSRARLSWAAQSAGRAAQPEKKLAIQKVFGSVPRRRCKRWILSTVPFFSTPQRSNVSFVTRVVILK